MKKPCTFFFRASWLSCSLLLCTLLAFSQDRTITGTVTDSKATPLPGVTVQAKGSQVATQTQANGSFNINVPASARALIFSFVGFSDQEVAIGNSSTISVSLIEAGQSLQDVVVVGYGTARKRDLTGAVGSVRAQQLQERPVASLNQALAGRIPGVQVNVNSGRPGGQTNVRIRGFSSINTTNNPLYVVDGVILPVGTQSNNSQAIDFINPSDIASMEVLKDASATAIYGARGANGVILITTKRGTAGGARITYDADAIIPTIGPKRVEMLNAREYLEVENLTYDNIKVYDPAGWAAGSYANVVDPRVKRKNLPLLFDSNGNPLYDTDWLEEVTQNKLGQNHQLGFTGGNADNTYGLFLGFRDENGLLINSYLQRYSARFTMDNKIKSWLKVGGSLSYNNQEENLVDVGTGGLNSVRMITEAFPFLPVKYPDGSWAENYNYPGAEGGSNPVHILNDRKVILNTQTLLGNVYAIINLTKDLEFQSQLGTSVVTRGINQYNGRTLDQISRTQNGTASVGNGRETFWSSENYFTYRKRNDIHSFTGLLGLSWQGTNIFNISASSQNFSTDFFQFNNIGAASQQNPGGSGRAEFAFNSYFARLTYGFRDKYLVTFTGRADGSSKFGENNKFSLFPSAAVAWRVSEEDFLKNSNTFSNLKVRASYGVTGNSEINTYAPDALLGTGYAAIINNTRVAGVGTNRLANPDLKWERTSQYDVGLEIGILNNRINLEADYYYRKTTDMLLNAPVPTSSGYGSITRNVGSMENRGFEFGLNAAVIRSEDFQWNATFNVSLNRNKVLALATPADIFGVGNPGFTNETGIIRVGESVGSFWGLVRLGVWQPSEAAEAAKFSSYRGGKPMLPGDIKYLDVNKDYVINDADRMIIGNGNPDTWGSFINNVRFKNFELVVDIQYMFGNDILNMMTHSGEDRQGIANSFKTVLEAYDPTKGNTNTTVAAIRDTRAGYVTNVDTRWVQDGSFIRGRNLLLSYSLPSSFIEKFHLSRLRIYGSVQNFFLKTDYNGNDPEVTTYGNPFAQGQTFFDYPKPTIYTFGLNVAL